MNFGFSEDQQTIKATARELLADRSPLARVREAAESGTGDERLWRELCEAVLLEELGYAVAATPFLGTVLAAAAIAHAGDNAQRARWLPGLASGELTGAFGGPALAADAPGAGVLVVVEDGAARVIAAADATVEPVDAVDPTRGYGRVSGEGEPLPGDVAGALDRGAAAIAPELVGVCQRARWTAARPRSRPSSSASASARST